MPPHVGARLFGGLTDRVDTSAKVVALTFDDGPDPAGARQLLDVLPLAEVPATFYLIGRDVAAHPDLAKAEFVAEEVEKTDDHVGCRAGIRS